MARIALVLLAIAVLATAFLLRAQPTPAANQQPSDGAQASASAAPDAGASGPRARAGAVDSAAATAAPATPAASGTLGRTSAVAGMPGGPDAAPRLATPASAHAQQPGVPSPSAAGAPGIAATAPASLATPGTAAPGTAAPGAAAAQPIAPAGGIEDPPQPRRTDAHLAGGVWIIGGPKQRPYAPVSPTSPNGDG